MTVKDCITSAMADGHISRDAGQEYIERFDELAEAIGGGSGKDVRAERLDRHGTRGVQARIHRASN